MSGVRLLLVDDHDLLRSGLSMLLQNVGGFTVIAEAASGQEALRYVATQRPDVVLMDIAMPDANGLETTAQIMREHPEVRVIILSMHANEVYVLQALRVGAAGYVCKDARLEELEAAIRTVAQGELYLTPAVSKYVVADYVRRTGKEESATAALTTRQRQILQLIAGGHTTQEIAKLLVISPKTVETHRSQMMERLCIRDLAGLIRYAIRAGLVSPDEGDT
ncbi:MAG: response regulator transcription factor [Abitibacteriaceae bacterium]|nr:response regulator transcription factor [Abditibacteriaceae bacterium]